MTISSRQRNWVAGLAAIVLLGAVAIYFIDWNALRPYIARKVSDQTGRKFAINGDLHVKLSLSPRITVSGVVLGNPAWSRDPDMLNVDRADFTISLLGLMHGQVLLSDVVLSNPRVTLEKNQDGAANWQFGQKNASDGGKMPEISGLRIDHGRLAYRDPTTDTDAALKIDTGAAGADATQQTVDIEGSGRYRGMPAELKGSVGALLSLLHDSDTPYPIDLAGTLGQTKVFAKGVLLNPLALKGEKIRFRLEGADMSHLFPQLGLPLPPTPPYKLAGELDHEGELWKFRGFKGTVGGSDLSGNFSVDRSKAPQAIVADLTSNNLDMADLGGFVGGKPGTNPKPPADANRVLPAEPYNLDKLRGADFDVKFTANKINTAKLPLEKMDTHLKVSGGVLQLDPLNFAVAGGNVVSSITLDASRPVIATKADLRVKKVQLQQLFPGSELNKMNVGTIGGRAQLHGTGNSIAAMLGSASGSTALIVDGGSISELLLRLSNLDIANSLVVFLTGDRQVEMRCMVGQFLAQDGDFKIQSLAIDTPKVNIGGGGNINMKNETVNIRLVAQSKGFSLASLRGPIDVTGTLSNLSATPAASSQAVGRGALAALLAVGTGVGAFIPLIEFGKDQDSNCTGLIENAKSSAGVKSGDMKP